MLSGGVMIAVWIFASGKMSHLCLDGVRGWLERWMDSIVLVLQRCVNIEHMLDMWKGWKWFVMPRMKRAGIGLEMGSKLDVKLLWKMRTIGVDTGGADAEAPLRHADNSWTDAKNMPIIYLIGAGAVANIYVRCFYDRWWCSSTKVEAQLSSQVRSTQKGAVVRREVEAYSERERGQCTRILVDGRYQRDALSYTARRYPVVYQMSLHRRCWCLKAKHVFQMESIQNEKRRSARPLAELDRHGRVQTQSARLMGNETFNVPFWLRLELNLPTFTLPGLTGWIRPTIRTPRVPSNDRKP
ncbi:hypothetical protein EV421DRAFT_1979763 [Armillaria borealis]|uniref:Uncharacterized protein n=1 Tax=Armillaria borealis TaxID=47425 RepID=A0AA39MJ32_9AGAR|nr:hypothetical protein EV421DRAFT_1979763 [Armillaria borealis]